MFGKKSSEPSGQTTQSQSLSGVTTKAKLWTVDDYHRMVVAGVLTGSDRVELLAGQIIEMNPQLPPHAATTQRAFRYLDRLLETVAYVRMQLPVTLKPTTRSDRHCKHCAYPSCIS